MAKQVDVTPHTYVRVEVIKDGVRWDGELLPKGEAFVAKQYEMEPAIVAGQVKLVAVLPDYDPAADREPEELAVGTEPPAEEANGGG